MTTSRRVWLTKEAFVRLQHELDHLLAMHGVGDSTDTAVSVDFDQHSVVSTDRRRARIQQIQQILSDAVVGEAPPDDGVAEPGMVLTVRFDDTEEITTFLLSVRGASEENGLETYSPKSPLGAALTGAKTGEQRTYTMPNGASVRVTLLRAVPYGQHAQSAPSETTVSK